MSSPGSRPTATCSRPSSADRSALSRVAEERGLPQVLAGLEAGEGLLLPARDEPPQGPEGRHVAVVDDQEPARPHLRYRPAEALGPAHAVDEHDVEAAAGEFIDSRDVVVEVTVLRAADGGEVRLGDEARRPTRDRPYICVQVTALDLLHPLRVVLHGGHP